MTEEINAYTIELDRKRKAHIDYLVSLQELLGAYVNYIDRCKKGGVDHTLEETLLDYGGRYRYYLEDFNLLYAPKL